MQFLRYYYYGIKKKMTFVMTNDDRAHYIEEEGFVIVDLENNRSL